MPPFIPRPRLTARRLSIAAAFGVAVVLVAVACSGPSVTPVATRGEGPGVADKAGAVQAPSGPFIALPKTADVPAAPSPLLQTVAPAVPATTATATAAAASVPTTSVPAPVAAIATPAPAPAAAAAAPAPPAKWLPTGKGMWIYLPASTEGGNVTAIVAKAKAAGLTHLWVRMGSAWDGFNVVPFIDQLLPAAHKAGIKVIGWDFPKLDPIEPDVQRALTMIRHTAPSGDKIDAFSADIETASEGTHLTPAAARAYGAALRSAIGDGYPLIATVPRPSKERASFPYADVTASYDAIAPMVYWLNRQPDTDVVGAIHDLAGFGKPILPVGQAYDGSAEGGRKGVPSPDELQRFMSVAHASGAQEVSFWSWQHANEPAWGAIAANTDFVPVLAGPAVTIPSDRPSA